MDWERSGFWGLRGDGLVIIRKPIHTVKETETPSGTAAGLRQGRFQGVFTADQETSEELQ